MTVPDSIWALLGISVGAAVGQPIVNGDSATTPANSDQVTAQVNNKAQAMKAAGDGRQLEDIKTELSERSAVKGQLVINRDPKYAKVSDMLHADEIGNVLSVDF